MGYQLDEIGEMVWDMGEGVGLTLRAFLARTRERSLTSREGRVTFLTGAGSHGYYDGRECVSSWSEVIVIVTSKEDILGTIS